MINENKNTTCTHINNIQESVSNLLINIFEEVLDRSQRKILNKDKFPTKETLED